VTRENRVEYTDLPAGRYTFQVKAVDRYLNYSEQPDTVAVEVFFQPVVSPVRLGEVQLQDLFASLYKSYSTRPLGFARVINDSPDSVAATLSFFLPDYMRRPALRSSRPRRWRRPAPPRPARWKWMRTVSTGSNSTDQDVYS
jgi:hypothetical protein